MILGKLGDIASEDFSVLDLSNSLKSGIDTSEFDVQIFNPSDANANSLVIHTVTELGSGHYRFKFTPNMVGMWYITITHPVYFPWGKTGNVQVFYNDFDSVAVMIKELLGLAQKDFYIEECQYDENDNLIYSRVKTYSDPSEVGTNNSILNTYEMEASYDEHNRMTSYKQVTI